MVEIIKKQNRNLDKKWRSIVKGSFSTTGGLTTIKTTFNKGIPLIGGYPDFSFLRFELLKN